MLYVHSPLEKDYATLSPKMSCLFEIQIDPDTVIVVVPEKGYSWKKPNLLAYILPSRHFVAAFTTAIEAEQAFQNSHPVNSELVIKPAFHPTDADSEIMMNALEYLVLCQSCFDG